VVAWLDLRLRRHEDATMLTNMLLRRTFDEPLSVADVVERARSSAWCYLLHKVDWRGSFLSMDGRALTCWFSAVDAESVRIALRQSGADTQFLFPCTVHKAAEPPIPNVIVERSFQDPVTYEEVRLVAEAAVGCFETHQVRYARTLFSLDRKRMVCMYAAPDAESVRITQREAGLQVDKIWAFQWISPKMLNLPGT
jgi:hypothetical protein